METLEIDRWYVLANRSETVVYKGKGRTGKQFDFVERLSNPEGRLAEKDLDSDEPGRGNSSAPGTSIRHGLDRRYFHHEETAKRFAAKIAKKIEKASQEGRFDKLILVAEPHFLGLMRAALTPEIRKKVELEIPRELTRRSDEEIRKYVTMA